MLEWSLINYVFTACSINTSPPQGCCSPDAHIQWSLMKDDVVNSLIAPSCEDRLPFVWAFILLPTNWAHALCLDKQLKVTVLWHDIWHQTQSLTLHCDCSVVLMMPQNDNTNKQQITGWSSVVKYSTLWNWYWTQSLSGQSTCVSALYPVVEG